MLASTIVAKSDEVEGGVLSLLRSRSEETISNSSRYAMLCYADKDKVCCRIYESLQNYAR